MNTRGVGGVGWEGKGVGAGGAVQGTAGLGASESKTFLDNQCRELNHFLVGTRVLLLEKVAS